MLAPESSLALGMAALLAPDEGTHASAPSPAESTDAAATPLRARTTYASEHASPTADATSVATAAPEALLKRSRGTVAEQDADGADDRVANLAAKRRRLLGDGDVVGASWPGKSASGPCPESPAPSAAGQNSDSPRVAPLEIPTDPPGAQGMVDLQVRRTPSVRCDIGTSAHSLLC